MQISIVYQGALIRGDVITRSPLILEVAIAHPSQALITSRHLRRGYQSKQEWQSLAEDMLIELHQMAIFIGASKQQHGFNDGLQNSHPDSIRINRATIPADKHPNFRIPQETRNDSDHRTRSLSPGPIA